jgi:hypothetical protein
MDHLRQRIQHHVRQNDSLLNSQIEVEEETITIHGPIWKWNWVSKLRDGLLPALVMLLLIVVPSLLMLPIQTRFGRPGLLVYMLVLLMLGMILLERSLHEDRPIIRKAWYGLAGGMLTWMAVEVTDRLSEAGLISLDAVPFFLILGLVIAILWRRVLPLPARWFVLVFFLNWSSRLIISGEQFVVGYFPHLQLIYPITIGIGIIGALASFFVIMWRSRNRLQRIQAAIGLWISTLLVLEVMFVKLL